MKTPDRVSTPRTLVAASMALLAASLAASGISGCTSNAPTSSSTPEPSLPERIESTTNDTVGAAGTAVMDAFDKKSLTVEFAQGTAALDSDEVRDLTSLVQAQDASTAQMKAYVASWPDTAATVSSTNADRNQVQLAESRLNAVKSALDQFNYKGDVVELNMAAPANAAERATNAEAAAIKEAFTGTEPSTTVGNKELADALRDKGGPGRTVVIFR